MGSRLTAIILAAGKGTRMKSRRAKVLHRICGRPILYYVLDAVRGVNPDEVLVVVGDRAEEVKAELGSEAVLFVEQREQKGTGHAVLQARGRAKGKVLLIVPGDLPLLTTPVLDRFLAHHVEEKADLSLLSVVLSEPGGYGRVLRDDKGTPVRIVEARDATPQELLTAEVNSGIYCVSNDGLLWETLASLSTANAQGEYYLPDLVERFRLVHRKVTAVAVDDPKRVLGVNSRAELALAEHIMREEILDKLMASGVTVVDPERTYVEPNVAVGPDTVLLPGTHLVGNSTIGEDCTIGPDAWIEDSTVEERCRVRYSVLESATVRAGSAIGPYAHLRPKADVGPDVRIGNFVEVKASRVNRGAKAGHLAYLGDAEIGAEANIGAGAITVNYDGKKKHRTIIGDRAFVGSNASLIAPVTIGEDAVVGAGSTITEDVPPGTLALGRARQVVKKKKEAKE
jgi:bifunctional UDP-N-acetylglucosamine pyrophosphorylase/glucosamine-1-phosphate N-acetyltransferase